MKRTAITKMMSFLICSGIVMGTFAPAVSADETEPGIPEDVEITEETETFSEETVFESEETIIEETALESAPEETIVSETEISETDVSETVEETIATEETGVEETLISEPSGTEEVLEEEEVDVEATSPVTINSTVFPDPAFRDYVSENFDTDSDGKLSASEIASVTNIYLYNRTEVEDITGVEYFTELQQLNIDYCSISELDLSKNTKLEELDSIDNPLSEIDLSKNTELKKMWLCGGTGATGLVPNSSRTEITELDLSNNTKLEELYCYGLKIYSLDIGMLTGLKKFNASYSVNLATIDASGLTELTSFQVYCCPSLKSVDLSGDGKLRYLVTDGTDLDSLDVTGCNSLCDLSVSFDDLDFFDTDFLRQNITYLTLTYGTCTSLDLSGFSSLFDVKLHYCSELSSVDLTGDVWLRKIDIWNCPITSLDLSDQDYLETLMLSYTAITSLDISELPYLQVLWCDGNPLTSLDLSGAENLKSLELPEIEAIDISDCPLLMSVYSSGISTSFSTNSRVVYGESSSSGPGMICYAGTVIKGGFGNPTGVKITAVTSDSVTLSWGAVEGASGYEVWRSTSSGGKYVCIADTTSTSKVSTNLSSGKDYYYKVRAYRTVNGVKQYSGYSREEKETTLKIPGITSLTRSGSAGASFNISWESDPGATGYQLMRSTAENGTYTTVCTTTKTNRTDTGLTVGTTYWYKVRSYRTVGGKTTYGSYGTPMMITVPMAPINFRAASSTRTTITLKWYAVSGTNINYEIWRSTSRNSGYVCLGRFDKTTKVSSNLSPNTTYYYKIRAYYYCYDSAGNVHRIYSDYAPVITGKTK
ncbi:MAG: fibronectin type III domain-containing protein [Clostridiales bacterium]|nr:fibronectin type III domain-containing protein [Clostridiales bacterium]